MALLPVALERIARERRTEEQEIVEVRHLALRPKAANLVEPGCRGPLDVVDRPAIERGTLLRLQPLVKRHRLVHSTPRVSIPDLRPRSSCKANAWRRRVGTREGRGRIQPGREAP